jgi:hypothetical protein
MNHKLLGIPNLPFLGGWYRRALAGWHRLASGLVGLRIVANRFRSSSDGRIQKCGGKCVGREWVRSLMVWARVSKKI